MDDEQTPTPSWRPTADSFGYLAAAWASLAVVAGVTVALRGAAAAVVVVGVAVLVVAGGVTAVWGGRRVGAALAEPVRPRLAGWPPSADAWAASLRAARRNGVRAALIAAVVGALGGLLPALGFGLAGAGVGGAAGALQLRRMVRRYERDHDVLVLTAGRQRSGETPRSGLILGIAEPPPLVGGSYGHR